MHVYVDQSDLNAQYDRMPLRGLGAHEYVDTCNLNAPYDYDPPYNMVGAGILSEPGLGSLGSTAVGANGASEFPWMEVSENTRELQLTHAQAVAARRLASGRPIGALVRRFPEEERTYRSVAYLLLETAMLLPP